MNSGSETGSILGSPARGVNGRATRTNLMQRRQFLAALAAAAAPSGFPEFNWDRTPVYGHLGKSPDDFTPAELDFLAGHFDFITIEKGQAVRKYGQTEEGIYEAARQLKRRNPRMKVLFYWNTLLDYPLYKARERVKPEWHLKDRHGRPALKSGTIPRYDLTIEDVREWWSDVAAEAMKKAPLDGIFADALLQTTGSGMAAIAGAEKTARMRDGLEAMLSLTRRKIGEDKIILANDLRGASGREYLDWDVSGGVIEHFGAFQTADAASMAADMETLGIGSRKSKIVVLKAWPGFTWLDAEMMKRPQEELAALARERITFPLACFLCGAQRDSYFCYSWGYREMHGTLEAYPELARPLGPPKGKAVREGFIYRREFQHASVRVDLAQKSAKIDWAQ